MTMNLQQLKESARGKATPSRVSFTGEGKQVKDYIITAEALDEIVTSTYLQAVENEKNNAAKIMNLILPLAKGYVSEHNVGSTRRYINLAEQYIDESSYFKSPDIKTI